MSVMERKQNANGEDTTDLSAKGTNELLNDSAGAIKKKNISKVKKNSDKKVAKKENTSIKRLQNSAERDIRGSPRSQRLIRMSSDEPKACKKPLAQGFNLDDGVWPGLSSPGQSRKWQRKSKMEKKLGKQVESDKVPISRPQKPFMDQPIQRSEFPKSLPSTPVCRKPSDKQPKRKAKTPQKKFEPYIPLFEVQQGLKRGEFIEGALRINPRSYEDAYVSAPDGQMDIYIGGIRDRNRALNGDSVVVQVNPKQEWKVLCDAIKDYEEKHGQSVVEPIYSPATSPCKIHTPDKFSRVQSRASSLWNDASGERRPDSLEILGIDKLAEQFGSVSMEAKKKANRGGKRTRGKRGSGKRRNKSTPSYEDSKMDSGSQKSSTSYSQASSEDYLNKMSSEDSPDRDAEILLPPPDFHHKNINENLTNEKIPEKPTNGYLVEQDNKILMSASSIPQSDSMNHEIPGTQELANSENPLESTTNSLSFVISPEVLLDFEGDGVLQQYCDQYLKGEVECLSDSCNSHVGGIVVAPDELSGDEFTDSASTSSSPIAQLDQIIEDSDFLTSQQDASNNNLDNFLNNVENIVNENILDTTVTTSRTLTFTEKSSELTSCKMEQKMSQEALSSINVISDSVCGTEILITSNENFSEPVQPEVMDITVFHPIEMQTDSANTAITIPSAHQTTNSNMVPSKRRRWRQRKSKSHNAQTPKPTNQDSAPRSNNTRKVESYTVEEVMKHPLWPKFMQKTGKIVYILEKKHPRVAVGFLKLLQDKNPNFALFSPRDCRVPRIRVPMSECPPGFYERPQDFSQYLFLASIDEWKDDAAFVQGRLLKNLGKKGSIDVETEGILLELNVDDSEFSQAVISCLPKSKDFVIPKEELQKRTDFRKHCIFTIDPSTARDMDDSVSCELNENGNYVVGVHIADVTYFIPEETALDAVAESRATSIYLVQKVVPMLPRILCDNLCSLAPGEDRLTFSVLWEMTPDAQIVEMWFEKSVIKSCIKMSYEHAQEIIQNPHKTWDPVELPKIFGPFTIEDIASRVRILHELALHLREKRFVDGALRLDQTKLQFTLDHNTGLPIRFSVYQQKDSNRLIEEFMLLANMSVARKIYESYPHLAILRRHPPPQGRVMKSVIKLVSSVGIHLDPTNSGTLQASIQLYSGDDEISQARSLILAHLCSKPMNCAQYFCSGILDDISMFHHYALNVPLYTHFTSPIRRYPDILVHRLLGAALGYNQTPKMQPKKLQKCANHCNDKKYSSKRASEMSDELFLAAFVQHFGPVDARAMVIGVMDHSFDCLVLQFGIVKRVYCDKLPLHTKSFKKIHGVPALTLVWKNRDNPNGLSQKLMIFSIVDVTLTTGPGDTLQIVASLKCCESEIYAC